LIRSLKVTGDYLANFPLKKESIHKVNLDEVAQGYRRLPCTSALKSDQAA
jgi:hypothetical protein